MTKTNQPKPLSVKDRIVYLDILRGISILFIFSANIPFLSGNYFLSEDTLKSFSTSSLDKILESIMYILVDGKFYSIFSLLFGIGFVVQYNNLKTYNNPFVPFFRRRMFWLTIIGLCHLVFFWAGDILTIYAILGFALILFKNKTNKQLLKWAVILILFPILNWLFLNFSGWYYPGYFFKSFSQYWQSLGFPMIDSGGGNLRPDHLHYYNIDSINTFFKVNIRRSLLRVGMILNEGRAFKLLGIFIIGVWAGRKILNENILTNTKLLKQIAFYGFLMGLPFSVFRGVIEFYLENNTIWSFMHTLTYALGTVPLAIAYAASIALICQNETAWLTWFAPVGRMALSNYLFQTLFSISLFHAFGFGLVGKISYTGLIALVFGVYICQNIFSRLWLKHFKFGPMEWVWRQLTYGKRISLKK